MKLIGLACLCLSIFATLGCGGGASSSLNLNGAWSAQLNNSGGTAFAFGATLTQGMGNTVTISNFLFGNSPICLSSPNSEAATFQKTGSFQNIPTGPFHMTISTMFSGAQNNVLTLDGNVAAGQNVLEHISGTWTLTGQSGCSDSGTFSMIPHPPM